MLRSERKVKNIILVTLFSFFFIGVGYALISSNLSIRGTLEVNKATWDIHLANVVMNENNTVSATPTLVNNDTGINYSLKLAAPGDFYSFTVDVVNSGTLNAMLTDINAAGLTADQANVINYTVTYENGILPQEKDSLQKDSSKTLVVTVSYKEDITADQLLDADIPLNLRLEISYAQDDGTSKKVPETLNDVMARNAVLDDQVSEFVTAQTGIDFSAHYSETNGNGIYEYSNSKNQEYPIYYYRGNIQNNNVIFNNFCWKIVRTTDTGGVKLLYNGLLSSDNKCDNTGNATNLSSYSQFMPNNELRYIGYTYEVDGVEKDSLVKNLIETWYENNMSTVSDKLEDTIYCNSPTGGNKNIANKDTLFTCNNKNESYTVSNNLGNQKLKYKIGLLTVKESVAAGGRYMPGTPQPETYLSNATAYWTMSPRDNEPATEGNMSTIHYIEANGSGGAGSSNNSHKLRPVISLKNGLKFTKGTGEINNPYFIG